MDFYQKTILYILKSTYKYGFTVSINTLALI